MLKVYSTCTQSLPVKIGKGGSGGGIPGIDRGICQITSWTHTTKNSDLENSSKKSLNKQATTNPSKEEESDFHSCHTVISKMSNFSMKNHEACKETKVWSIYRKKKWTEPDHSEILAGNASILHFQNRITRYKISKNIKDMNNPVNQLELTDTYIGHSI